MKDNCPHKEPSWLHLSKWQWATDSEQMAVCTLSIYKFTYYIYKFTILQIVVYTYERQMPPQGALMASSEHVQVSK